MCVCVCVHVCMCLLCPAVPCAHLPPRLSVSDIKYWLRRFSSMDRDRDGFITADDLLHYLAVPSDACTLALFSALAEVSAEVCRLVTSNLALTGDRGQVELQTLLAWSDGFVPAIYL